mgnify:CR=1 FL=1
MIIFDFYQVETPINVYLHPISTHSGGFQGICHHQKCLIFNTCAARQRFEIANSRNERKKNIEFSPKKLKK